ncbi:MAG TPA: hypothetical protein VD913_02845 [bacterium]|nr:hypothetical protein [bacterium]
MSQGKTGKLGNLFFSFFLPLLSIFFFLSNPLFAREIQPEGESQRPRVVIGEPAKTPATTRIVPSVTAQTPKPPPAPVRPQGPNLYVDQFFMKPGQRLQYEASEVLGFILVRTPNPQRNTQYSVVTDFGGGVLKSQYLWGINTLEDMKSWTESHLETAEFQGVEIKRMAIPTDKDQQKTLFWVGNRSFDTYEKAQAQVALLESVVQAQGGNFQQLVASAPMYLPPPEQPPPVEISAAQYQKEEELVLKMLDQLDIGEKLWGPFHGVPAGEPIIWQSFGETSYRMTNLSERDFHSQVGFWTNRLVFKGIRAPLNTIDPYVEATTALEATGTDFASVLRLFAGFEWRPLQRNPWLLNFRPWGGIHILEWIRNWRLYVVYGQRYNLKDEITNSEDHDVIFGAQIFYEWGVELPPLDQPRPSRFSDYVEQYVWGEYFGDYRHETTNFGPNDDFNSWILNSNIHLGIKLPGIPLPSNPINDELVLMPYVRFEEVTNTSSSFAFQNQYFVAAGIRVMPFRNWRYKENEWLSKTKLFAEWVGVGRVQNFRQDGEAPDVVDFDLRFGVNISNRRF